MKFNKSILALSLSAALITVAGCSSDSNNNPAPTGNVGNDTFNQIGLPLVSEWFANSGANNDSTSTAAYDATGYIPTGAFKTATESGLTFTPTTAQTTMGFVATSYAGAVDPNGTDWTQNWTVGIHGNDNVWAPASGGTLGGATPTATGTCPAGTTLNGTTSSEVVDGTNSMDVCDLPAQITADLTLTNDNIYLLASGFPGTKVGDGDALGGPSGSNNATLTIEPGTLIMGSTGEALVITRGSAIAVNGTEADPVVMTSYESRPFTGVTQTNGRGEWAGLALMGNAATNECGTPCDVAAEGNIGYYGGVDDTDDSGTINYLVIKHAGNDIDGNGNELNGFTLFGVGSGTTVDYLQVHKGLDDGIEHFGSADFASHIVLTANADDSFDWGQGYTGGAQFVLIMQADDDGDRGIEADNDHGNPVATPVSQPQLANFTMIAASSPADSTADGILLRRGTGANIYNSIITGFADACLDVDEEATMDAAWNGTGTDYTTGYTGVMTIDNSFVDCATDFESGDQNLDGV